MTKVLPYVVLVLGLGMEFVLALIGTAQTTQVDLQRQSTGLNTRSLVQSTPTTITMQPGAVWTQVGTSVYAAAATVKVIGGSDTGRFWLGYNSQGQRICQYAPGVGGVNMANYTVTGFAGNTCTTPVLSQGGVYTSGTVPVTGGVFGVPTDFRADAVAVGTF